MINPDPVVGEMLLIVIVAGLAGGAVMGSIDVLERPMCSIFHNPRPVEPKPWNGEQWLAFGVGLLVLVLPATVLLLLQPA